MSRCTAPVRGHSSSAAAAACPACRSRGYGRAYGGYPTPYGSGSGGGGGGGYGSGSSTSGGRSSVRARPSWARTGSSLSYTLNEVQSLSPVRETVEARAAAQPDLRDAFLCHAWGDRRDAAKELNDLLEAAGVKVWFSEKDLPLGVPMMRAIDKGLANSRIGLVLVTPALLVKIKEEGVAEKELAALLARNLLVPILHNVSFDELSEVSPLLASRSGLSTKEDSMAVVAEKIADLVTVANAAHAAAKNEKA